MSICLLGGLKAFCLKLAALRYVLFCFSVWCVLFVFYSCVLCVRFAMFKHCVKDRDRAMGFEV